MLDFSFQSITTSGEIRTGILKGRDRADIVQQLSGLGETAIEINQVEDQDGLPWMMCNLSMTG